ncbi:MAG: ribosome silencing factor [Pseudomonadota bacterium]
MKKEKFATSRALAKRIAEIADDHKAVDIVVLDLKKLTSFTDYFVIASGASDRQVQSVAGAISEELKKAGRRPLGEEGLGSGQWALIDYGEVVAHIFYHEERDHYQLEKLWHDAPRVVFKGINS